MSLARAMEAAVMAHVGVRQSALVTPEHITITTYEEAREVLGSNEEIAEQAGYGAPGQYRKGTTEWRRRESFMRQLQRGEQRRSGGTGESRSAANIAPRVVTVANIETNRINTPKGVADVIRLMGMRGTTTSFVKATFAYSSPKNPRRDRQIEASVYTAQSVYRDVGWRMRGFRPQDEEAWDQLGQQYLEAWAIAYGMAGEVVAGGTANDPIFIFTIGGEEGVQYDYT